MRCCSSFGLAECGEEPHARRCLPALPQFFEGLALGSAAIEAGIDTSKALLVALTYSLSTPVGTALGELCGMPCCSVPTR